MSTGMSHRPSSFLEAISFEKEKSFELHPFSIESAQWSAAPSISERPYTASSHVPLRKSYEDAVPPPLPPPLKADPGSPLKPAGDGGDSTENYMPMGPRLYLITFSLMLAVFCVALDNTIISVAIPRITDDFHNLNDVGWYASSYLLTNCAFQLLFGKIYSIFNVKHVFLISLFLFEFGSLICGISPNSTALIVGRAVAGFGSSGIFSGALIVIANTVVLEKRPTFFGFIGGMYGFASVAGPLLGGAFTNDSHLTWRWCFYINLPLGGATAAGIIICLRLKAKKKKTVRQSWLRTFKNLDPIGTLVFVPAIVCLLLALQWGGVNYAWSDPRIIALFVVFGVVIICFVVLQYFLKEDATVPARIAAQRSIMFASFFALCASGSFFIIIIYIPMWFQAILGASPVTSGIDYLPMVLANVFALILAGGLVSKFGYYVPFFIASSVVMSVGAGLLTMFTAETSQPMWIGFQFLYGLGVGIGFQMPGVAAQTALPPADVSVGTAVVLFLQLFGGALFVAVAQNLFTNELVKRLVALRIPGIDPGTIVSAGATNLRHVVDPQHLPQVLVEYNAAIIKTFQLGLILACLSIIGALGVEWKSVKGKQTSVAAA